MMNRRKSTGMFGPGISYKRIMEILTSLRARPNNLSTRECPRNCNSGWKPSMKIRSKGKPSSTSPNATSMTTWMTSPEGVLLYTIYYNNNPSSIFVPFLVHLLPDDAQAHKHHDIPGYYPVGVGLEPFVEGKRALFKSFNQAVHHSRILTWLCVHDSGLEHIDRTAHHASREPGNG